MTPNTDRSPFEVFCAIVGLSGVIALGAVVLSWISALTF